MKAAVMEGINKLVLKDIPLPVINEEEVLVKVKACSICGSDVQSLETGLWMPNLPTVPGHEVSGVIVEAGCRVEGLRIGDRVALEPNIPCRKCDLCKRGYYHLCERTVHIGNHINGGFAEYVKIHYMNAYKFSDWVSFEEAALMEPIGVCLEAVRRSRLTIGEDVLIVGDGPFGLLFLQLCSIAGANNIYISGRRDFRLNVAKKYGAIVIDARKEDVAERILSETNGKGVPVIFDASGSTSFFDSALKVAAYRGRIVLFSYTKDKPQFDITPVHLKELDILGSVNNPHTFEDVDRLLNRKKVVLSDIITHRLRLEQIHEGMEMIKKKENRLIKAVVIFEDEAVCEADRVIT